MPPAPRLVPVVLRHPGGETELHASALGVAADAAAAHPARSRSEAIAATIQQLATAIGADVSDQDAAAAAADIQRRRRDGGTDPVADG